MKATEKSNALSTINISHSNSSSAPTFSRAKTKIRSSNNAVMFVNYQGKGTLGRRVQSKPREITMATRGNARARLTLNAQVYTVQGFSAHSDHKQLMAYLGKMKPRPKRVMVVHGEASKAMELASKVRSTMRIHAKVPQLLEVVRLK